MAVMTPVQTDNTEDSDGRNQWITLTFRVEPDLDAMVRKLAEEDGRDYGPWLRRFLRRKLEEDGLLEPRQR